MASDTLQSTSFARIIDLVSEGEIEGLVAGAQSIYLDGTPVQAANGTMNFSGVKFVARTGLPNQGYIPGFPATENTTPVNVELKENVPAVRTVTDDDVDSVLAIVSVPALSRTDRDDGDVVATSVRLRVEVQVGAGSWVQVSAGGTDTVPLKTTASGVGTTGYDNVSRATVVATASLASGDNPYVTLTLRRRPLSGGAWTTIEAREAMIDAPTSFEQTMTAGAWEWSVLVAEIGGSGSVYTLRLSGTFLSATPDMTITGKTSSKYQRAVSIAKPGTAPWSVRITRLTDDSDSEYLQNRTFWDSYVEVIDERLRMPHSALMALTIDARQIGNIPTRGYDMRLLKVKVPSNYNGRTRTYTGSWDGTFKAAKEWTDDPAWCFYDLCTNPRYGLGAFLGTGVDKWALYQISQYCNELVPNGFGGTERRFSCNVYIASRAEAFKVINDMASIFRAMVYWSSGSLTLTQDAPGDPVAHYAPANVIDGVFNYSGSSLKQRHTVALVTWNDPADLYRQKVEYVPDDAGIKLYGIVETQVAAFGCTSRGQAHRLGRAILLSERLLSELVTFRTGLEGVLARPGQVIQIADPLRAGVRYGGRLLAATTASVTIDAPVDLVAGRTYTFYCYDDQGAVQEATVTTGAGTGVSTLALSPALAVAPAVGSMWVMSCNEVQTQLFRVLAATEVDRGTVEISAIQHNPTKFDAIDLGLTLQPRDVSDLNAKPDALQNLAVSEVLYARGQQLATRLDVSWSLPAGANAAAVSWRRSDGASSPEQLVYEAGLEVDGAQEGQVYTFTAYAVNPLGARSAEAATYTYTVLGKGAPPANVQGFVVARFGDTLNFGWRPVADLDCARYEVRRGDVWETGVIVGSSTHPTNVLGVTAPRGGTFMIKAIDTSGVESATAAYVIAADASGINVVVSYDDAAAGFPGTYDNTALMTRSGSPSWAGTPGAWEDAATWDAMTVVRGVVLNGGVTSGTYTTLAVDVGYIASSVVSISSVVQTLGPLSNPWNTYTSPWSSYTAPAWVWRPESTVVGASYEVRTSEDGLTWTEWATFTPGLYRFRYLQARVTLSTSDLNFRPFMTALDLLIDVPDRVEHFADVAVPSAGATLTFTPAFVGVQTIQVTLQSAAAGDTVKVTSKTTGSVTLQVLDGTGAPKAGLLDVDVFGYGERF